MEQIRIIKEMREADKQRGRSDLDVRPRYGIWENVPGAFSSAEGEDFRLVLQAFLQIEEPSLHVIGPADRRWEYAGILLGDRSCVAWVTWDAQYLGVPQRRRRIFLVADFAAYSPIEILFIPNSLQGHPTPGSKTWQAAARGTLCGTGNTGRPQRGTGVGDHLTRIAFTANQREEIRDLGGVSAALAAQPGMHQQTFVASFSTGAGSSAGSIAYSKRVAPTLKGSASGNCMPSVLCLNDQGGQVMDCTENMTGTLRAQEHGHQPIVFDAHGQDTRYKGPVQCTSTLSASALNQPLVIHSALELYENHGIDARYRGPLTVAPTLSARAGIGGNNLSLIAPSVFARNRTDCFVSSIIASTQSARQCKDATDLIYQETVGALTSSDRKGPNSQYVGQNKLVVAAPHLIRRLTPLECERLQGFPDGWTGLPGASDAARYQALGNSVAIPCVEYLMRRVALSLLLGFQGNLCSLC